MSHNWQARGAAFPIKYGERSHARFEAYLTANNSIATCWPCSVLSTELSWEAHRSHQRLCWTVAESVGSCLCLWHSPLNALGCAQTGLLIPSGANFAHGALALSRFWQSLPLSLHHLRMMSEVSPVPTPLAMRAHLSHTALAPQEP